MYHCKVSSSFLYTLQGSHSNRKTYKNSAIIYLISHARMCCDLNHIYRNFIYSNSLIQYDKLYNENVPRLLFNEKYRKAKVQIKSSEYYIITS